MGLDSFWIHPERGQDDGVVFEPPLRLCGGMMSAHGAGSFRGKVYANLLLEVTGVDTYNHVSPKTVKEMAVALEASPWPESLPFEEWQDLQRMFIRYAEEGYSLSAWF